MDKFINELSEIFDVNSGDLTPSTVFSDLESWTSFTAVQLIVLFDEEYSKIVSAADIRDCKTINDLFDLTK